MAMERKPDPAMPRGKVFTCVSTPGGRQEDPLLFDVTSQNKHRLTVPSSRNKKVQALIESLGVKARRWFSKLDEIPGLNLGTHPKPLVKYGRVVNFLCSGETRIEEGTPVAKATTRT